MTRKRVTALVAVLRLALHGSLLQTLVAGAAAGLASTGYCGLAHLSTLLPVKPTGARHTAA